MVGMRKTGSISTHWPPHSQYPPLYKVPSSVTIKGDLGRSKEEACCSRYQAIAVAVVDPSPRVPAEVSRLLCPRVKNWTRDTRLEIEIEK